MLDIPIDLPGNSLTDQLIRVANWAGIDPSLLLERRTEIASAFNERKRLIEILLLCSPKEPWRWTAYEAQIAAELAQHSTAGFDDDEIPIADDVREFHSDSLRDMVAHIADKLVTNHHALYRKEQIDVVQHLRPFLQLRGTCAGAGGRKTLMANDPTWKTHCLPWQCSRLLCRCQAHSLSRPELKRYVEGGCDAGDEAAAELTYD